ncbi:MAG: hypothetical protein VST70_01310 [Nitrospirota bacterium]|nr:hypothetical protein [Nitrospirota bacterium]
MPETGAVRSASPHAGPDFLTGQGFSGDPPSGESRCPIGAKAALTRNPGRIPGKRSAARAPGRADVLPENTSITTGLFLGNNDRRIVSEEY